MPIKDPITTAERRREVLAEWYAEYDNPQSVSTLVDTCLLLRMSLNGSADPWPDADILKAVHLLQKRLEVWSPSRLDDEEMDNAIQDLVKATLSYAKQHAVLKICYDLLPEWKKVAMGGVAP